MFKRLPFLVTFFLFIGKENVMKNIFKIIIFCLFFGLLSCGTGKVSVDTTWAEIGLDGYMVRDFERYLTREQLDSLCIADTLSLDLNEWYHMSMYSEDRVRVTQYLYIKATETETLYTVQEERDSIYYVTIRRIKEEVK